MRSQYLISVLLLLLSTSTPASTSFEAEIEHLTQTVRNSPCQFIRNGDVHAGPDAAEHMLDKYDYFEDEIHTAEDFIRQAASKSTLTGKPYEVKCANSHLTSQQWLLRHLEAFRQNRSPQ